MDTNHTRFTLRVSIGVVVAALLMGQAAIATETPEHPVAKSTKPAKKAKVAKRAKKATPAPKSAQATSAVKQAEAVTAAKPAKAAAKAVESSALGAEARELTEPKSTIEAGVLGVTDGNWKFGQYNGLNNSGAYGIGNFDLRGGGAYDSGDATRWRITGRNIGLETREFTGEYKDQGKYKLNFGYDEIYRNGQGSYQTPYLGVGGNYLNLPSNWNAPAGSNLNMRNLNPTQLADFQNIDLATKRKRVDGGFSYFLNPEWELKASMRHEDKNGTQALGAPIVGSRSVILPAPISQSTDQVNASMNFTGQKAFGSLAYYGSIFHNDFDSITFDNAFQKGSATNPATGRMSTAPDNQFHQFSLSGGYNFSPDTKLVGNGGYGLTLQNESFLPYSTSTNSTGSPRSSLDGFVQTTAVNAKLTHKVDKDLNFAASYKFDERDNHTPVSQYKFTDVDVIGTANNIRSNTPYSKKLQQGNLDANYSFAQGQWLKIGYEIQNIDRWCNGTWTSCVDTGTTLENTGRIDYRGSFFDKINAKLGYAYSNRSADNYNQDAAWAASFTSPQAMAFYNQISALGIPAWGPALGYPKGTVPYPYPSLFPNNNTGYSSTLMSSNPNSPIDIAGLGRFNTSARNRQNVNSRLDYQVTDKLSLGLNGDYRYDDYPQSAYGLQSQRTWSINFDTSYAFNEDFSGHVFYTFQDNMSNTVGSSYGSNSNTGSTTAGSVVGGCYNNVLAKNNNAKIDPCLNWLSNMSDNIDTVGMGLKHKGLLSGKLDLTGDFLYSFARTQVDVNGGTYSQVTGANTTNGPYYYTPATNMPEVKTQVFQFNLSAKYAFNKSSSAHLTYIFQHMISNDYIYSGMSVAGTPTGVMPTLEQAPVYTVHAFGLSYLYNF